MLIYLLKVNIAIGLFYILYRLVFAKLTFFQFNRFYILFAGLASFLLPIIRIPLPESEFGAADFSMGFHWDQIVQGPVFAESIENAKSVFQPLPFILLGCAVISALFLFRGIRQFYKIRKLFSNGDIHVRNGIRLIVHPEINSSFTMFRTVYLDRYIYEKNISAVISHEMVHARQLHSIDLLIVEIICAILWFNPFVFLFRRQMRVNHEFLADQVAHKSEVGLITYMQALSMELTRKYDPAYASYFQSSTLKKRIIMLTNRESKNSKKWFYLLIIPIIGLMAMAFQQAVNPTLNEGALLQVQKGNKQSMSVFMSGEIPSLFPLEAKYKNSVTLNYGWEGKNPVTQKMMKHKGVDFSAPEGSPVYAAANGVVAKSSQDDAYGKVIVLNHDEAFSTLYAHLNELTVKEGEKVKIGQKIGTVGNTGYSTGAHLHYEVRKAGENVDPADYF